MITYEGKIVKKIAFLFGLLAVSVTASAGLQQGKITKVVVRASDNLHYFHMSGTAYDKPPCATGTYWTIKDENSISGKSQISILLAAYVSKQTITVAGAGTCTRWLDAEDVDTIFVGDE